MIPSGTDSRLAGLNVDTITIGSTLKITNTGIESLTGDLLLSSNTSIINVDNSIISQVATAVNPFDAVNLSLLQQYNANTINYI